MIKLTVNGTSRNVDADPDTPLLWVLREWLGMTGTKYGCGVALCGACTVHLDGIPRRSCVMPVSAAVGHRDFPLIGGGLLEHLPRRGAAVTDVFMGHPDAAAAAG